MGTRTEVVVGIPPDQLERRRNLQAYNASEAPAPMILAKGAGAVAERIKEIARQNSVPVRENKSLARVLYKVVEVGDTIPEEFYQAVAAILAQVYKARPRRQ